MTSIGTTAEVLVLNRVYLPIRIVTARRAFCLLYQGKARVLLHDYSTLGFSEWALMQPLPERPVIRLTAGRVLGVPSVVVLGAFAGLPRHEVRFTRRNVFQRDGYRCQYCGIGKPLRELNIDHVHPVSLGGASTWENVVCCCIPCNRRKGNKTPEQAGMQLLRPVKRPRWHPLHDVRRRDDVPSQWALFVDASTERGQGRR